MKTILITGSGGLVGSTCVNFFLEKGYRVVGIDNNQREYFFGKDGSVQNKIDSISKLDNYIHYNIDIRDELDLEKVFFQNRNEEITAIIHTAGQPSHDYGSQHPILDFQINAVATLQLLELYKKYCKDAFFIFTSTNKVYGDNPNYLKLIEQETRYELSKDNIYYDGIDESFPVGGDKTIHSLFGCSKLSADMYVQEYGKNFGLKTFVLRYGCISGAAHQSSENHGFLNYLVKCNLEKRTYRLFGYQGKQVRDNIHAIDLALSFNEIINGESKHGIYNMGGGRESNCSILEAIEYIESKTGNKFDINYIEQNRIGDHIWYISDISKFKNDYPNWKLTYNVHQIIDEIILNIGK